MVVRFISTHRIIIIRVIPIVRTNPTVRIVRADRSRIDPAVPNPTDRSRIVLKPAVHRRSLQKLPDPRTAEQATGQNSTPIQQTVSQQRMTDRIQAEGMEDEDNKFCYPDKNKKLLQSPTAGAFLI